MLNVKVTSSPDLRIRLKAISHANAPRAETPFLPASSSRASILHFLFGILHSMKPGYVFQNRCTSSLSENYLMAYERQILSCTSRNCIQSAQLPHQSRPPKADVPSSRLVQNNICSLSAHQQFSDRLLVLWELSK